MAEIRVWPLRVVKYELSFWNSFGVEYTISEVKYALSEHLISRVKYALSEAWISGFLLKWNKCRICGGCYFSGCYLGYRTLDLKVVWAEVTPIVPFQSQYAEGTVLDFPFQRFWKPKDKFRTQAERQVLDSHFEGLQNFLRKMSELSSSQLLNKSGLWNLGC
ncbi:hypothetical protein RIR_jg21975.t1 [Rhizophagus irregularis DAOM 181602=DAOM 197198]|nr:hypothetical protein RIR_jg21975.t1 [Rhizophagus irregularis DAOM 181602=DAOM 197198]